MNLDKRLLHQARGSRVALAITIGIGFVAGVLTVVQAGYLSRVIDQVFLDERSLREVSSLLVILLSVILLRAFLVWGSESAANALAMRVKTGLRQQLFQHILDLGPLYARGERTGELTSVAVQGIEALDAYFSQYLPQLVLAVLVPITFLVIVFPYDLLSGMVLLLTAPLIPLFMVLIGNVAQALTRRQWNALSRMSAYFLDVLQGLTTLKILGRSRAQIQVITQVSDRFRQTTMSVLRVTFLSALVLEMVSTLSTAVVAVEVGLRLLYGRLSFEQAFFVLLLAPEFYFPLRLLGTRFHAGMSGVEAAKRIFAILETPVLGKDGGLRTDNGLAVSFGDAICFEDVHFTYNDGRLALKGVTFQIEAGQKVALVGPSGAGKSTIASLLLGFIEPAQGRITVGERSLVEFSPEEWRAHIAWVSQKPYLFYGTVADNIRLGRPDAGLEQVVSAAKQAHAHEFIQTLPQGYDTLIGERGARLSGGERQRLALARAFLRDANFIILDEATANLDPKNEALIHEAMERLLEGRTALMIAHRLNTVVKADRILVLEDGQVVEAGTHVELSRRDGLYRRLVTAYADGIPAGGVDLSSIDTLERSVGQDNSQISTSPLLPGGSNPPAPVPFSPIPSDSVTPIPVLMRLLKLASPLKGLVALSVLMGVATIGSGIGLMTTSAYIISAAALGPSIAELQVAIVGVRFFGVARGLFRYLERYMSHQVTFRLLARLRTWFYRTLEPLAPARLMSYRSGDLLARILGDIESLENFYVRVLAPPLVAILVVLGMGIFLARFDEELAWLLLVFLLVAGVGVPLMTRLLGHNPGRQLVQQWAALNVALVDGIQGMADLLVYNQGRRHAGYIRVLSQRLAAAQTQMARINGMQTAMNFLLANLGMWGVLVTAIPLVQRGQIDGVYLAVLVLAALTSFEAVSPLPLAAQYLESNLQAARRLFEVVDSSPEVRDPVESLPLPQDFSLEVKKLRFRYPPSSIPTKYLEEQGWVLDDLNFCLPQGKRLAIVGPSGAGKSTLVNLLLRFWEFEVGNISLGGGDLRRYKQDEVRSLMGVVSQNAYLFSASVRDNLRIACPKASQVDIVRAAKGAQIHDFIQSLPQGYDTWIGDQGLRLSAGERQRLAIARALLKDAPLLILDEPTANLDAITERQVFDAMEAVMLGRTTLMITHRIVSPDKMDDILVVDQGRVVERGRHAELLAAGGLYRWMWDLQNQLLVL